MYNVLLEKNDILFFSIPGIKFMNLNQEKTKAFLTCSELKNVSHCVSNLNSGNTYKIISETGFLDFPYPSYLLVIIDYIAFYLPKIWFEKFGFIQKILNDKNHFAQELQEINGYFVLDLTNDFFTTADLANINYDYLGRDIMTLCQKNVLSSGRYDKLEFNKIHNIEPLRPFLEFLCYRWKKEEVADSNP